MPRTTTISLPGDKTQKAVADIQKIDGVIGISLQKDSSIMPKGDIITINSTNNAVSKILLLLEEQELLQAENISISTSRPLSIISKKYATAIFTENNESSWEEAMSSINHESSMSLNGMFIMFVAGIIATYGIVNNALHIVVGAMVVAPGFEPVTRIALGLVCRNENWKYGLTDTLKGYLILIAGSIAAAFYIMLFGQSLFPGSTSYLSSSLISYWTTITITSLTVSAMASLAGAIIILTNKSVLTAGIMITLSLVPSASITGIGLVAGDLQLAGIAFVRLLLEIFIVFAFSGIVILWKRHTTHKRDMV
jgi:hypothetical protein